MPAIVTLTTDFGEREPFVATIKGVLLSRCPGVQVVDLSHQIPRDSVMEGARFVEHAVSFFPAGTVHLVGIAPGPAPIAVSIAEQTIVCPDNGVVTILADRHEIAEARAIPVPEEIQARSGQTFFAREVFAPVAARLAAGTPLAEIGELVDGVKLLGIPRPRNEGKKTVVGEIIHVDRFGNLITNIHRSFLEGLSIQRVEAGHFPIGPLRGTYTDVPPGKPLALSGSAGYLEIAYNGDRADARLEYGKGIIVKLTVEPVGR